MITYAEKIKTLEAPKELSQAGLEIVKKVEAKLLAISQEIKEDIKEEIDRKVKIIKSYEADPQKVEVKDYFFGQYKGYNKEKMVKRDSKTDTFVALKLVINNSRWRGVPFFVKVGKNLNKKDTSIIINFKKVDCLLDSCPRDTNYFKIRVQPDEGFTLELNSKVQGKNFEVVPVKMDFSHKNLYSFNTPQAYEILLENIIEGDQSLFVRNDEIEYAWKVIDKINKRKVYSYKKGSKGPVELDKWSVKNKMEWRK